MKASSILLALALSICTMSLYAQGSTTTNAAASTSVELQLRDLKARSVQLIETLSQLRQRYADSHPDIDAVLGSLNEAEQRLAEFESAHQDEISIIGVESSDAQGTGSAAGDPGSQPNE